MHEFQLPSGAGMEYGHQIVGLEGDTRYRAFLHGPCEIPFHWHPEVEIVAVLRGAVNLAVAGEQCSMRAGDLMIINANVMHNSMSWSDETIVYGIHIDAEHFDRNGLPGFADRFFLCKSFLHGQSFEKVSGPIRSLISRIVLNSALHPEEGMVRHILANLLCYFVYRRVAWTSLDKSHLGSSNIGRERVMSIMRKVRADADVNLGTIAEAEGLTLSHLSRLFRTCAGIGFRDYVQNIRLDRAVYQLRTTSRTISQIMEEAGFSNPTHFFAKFRERFGCSPAEYRRQQKQSVGIADVKDADRSAIAALLKAEIERMSDALELLRTVPEVEEGHYVFAAPHNFTIPMASSAVA
jgi:AraC-like DNA-binding protein